MAAASDFRKKISVLHFDVGFVTQRAGAGTAAATIH